MARLSKVPITNVRTAVAVLIAAAIAIYALFLLVVGQPIMVAQPGESPPSVHYEPHLAALVPLIAVALLLGGLLARKMGLAWIGFATLLVFAAAFLFSIGGVLLPLAGTLLILLSIIQTCRLVFAWMLRIVLFIASILLRFTLAVGIFSVSGLFLMLVTWVAFMQRQAGQAI